MSIVIRMPQLAAGGADAAIQSWLVSVGDEVAAGQSIVEIETEKAVVEQESEAAGTVAAIFVAAGEAAAVGAPIAVLAEPGEQAEKAIADAAAETGGAAVAAPADTPESAPASAAATPAASAPTAAPVAVPTPAPAASDSAENGARIFSSPLVRKLARERGIDLSTVTGSGPRGRIVRRDLDALPAASAPAAAAAPAPATAAPATAGYTDIPHTGMRRAIARRLLESKTTIPHFTLTAECRIDELLALRARVNESAPVKISVNDFVLKAVAAAFVDVPDANVIWTDEATRKFDAVDLAVAVSIPGGLVTPVLRSVERMPLSVVSGAVRDLAERSREGRITQQELEGGSFSVSNLGMYGTKEFSAIINPPHSGILAVGAGTRRPVVGEDGELTVATVMNVTLSADHRVLDGALAAQWLAAFVRRIENPLSVLI